MSKDNDLIKKCFDLTNNQGAKSVLVFLIPEAFKLGDYLLKSVFGTDRTETQAEMAERIIKKGKEDGVDEMDITMDNSKGFKLNLPIEGVDIETKIGTDEKMHVRVKYK